ncbi:MAG TPA: CvpA family protein [Acetobacteraceae bacterium]|jgi:membrane protein required for colicin V production|nr:CvpA family protein [Acetobacteraceae bacterium]
MTWVDFVVLAVLALSALLAFMRGLVREVLGLAAWIGAIFAGVWGVPRARPHAQELLGTSPWADPVTFAVIFIIALIVLMLVSRWISAMVRASPVGGLDRTLGLVFGLVRGAALLVLAYIIAGMVVQVDRWPDAVLQARSLPLVYQGASWAVQRLPADHRPLLYAPPPGRETTADALLHATPQGRAVGKPPVRD